MSRKAYFVSNKNLKILKRVRTFYLVENGPKNLVGMVDGEPVYLSEQVPSNYIYEAEIPDKGELPQLFISTWKTQKVVWHNLKESPEDLPKEEGLYFVELKKILTTRYRLAYFNGEKWSTNTQILGWCVYKVGASRLIKFKVTRRGISNFKGILVVDPFAKKIENGKAIQLSSGEIIKPGDYILG